MAAFGMAMDYIASSIQQVQFLFDYHTSSFIQIRIPLLPI